MITFPIEKDGLFTGKADNSLSLMELSENQMETDCYENGEMGQDTFGTEKTKFTATINDGEVKVSLHIRPKSKEDLEKWKNVLAKGKEDDEKYTYTFSKEHTVTDENKEKIAKDIIDIIKKGNEVNSNKLKTDQKAYLEDVKSQLSNKKYEKGSTIKFKTYTVLSELVYIKVSPPSLPHKNGALPRVFYKDDKDKFKILNANWRDPVDNPISTNYFQNGNFDNISKIWGLFGDDIRKEVNRKHTGIDLFAVTGTKVYACVDGTIYNRRWHSGYGNTITIKAKDPISFLKLKKDDYVHKTSREIKDGENWDETGDIFLFYAHLDSVNEFSKGQDVKCGDELGTTGRSGVVGGTHAPHLHFEIFCKYKMGTGTKYRVNPAYFFNYKFYDDQSEEERNAQLEEKKRGKINEVNGKQKLSAVDLS